MQAQAPYESWSNADLIQRVTDLEAQLRAQNLQHARIESCEASANPAKKKPKKVSKPFDPSRYHTRLIALKFAYLGGNYNGFEHHSNNTTPLPTIEEELWKALKKTKLIFPIHKPGQSEDEVSWEGCEYSKCGRTDRGVSAFGQVIGIRVRSNRPKSTAPVSAAPSRIGAEQTENKTEADKRSQTQDALSSDGSEQHEPSFDPVRDELPYIQLINRVLPPDIRILAWCANPPPSFSARFNCKERRYRYFFTNPSFMPLPNTDLQSGRLAEGWLDMEAMQEAAKKYEGLHDFRNLCKVDPSKQITNFERRIFHAGIHEVRSGSPISSSDGSSSLVTPKLYYFEVRGSAFLWHQVRHLVAILFLIGQGYEAPSLVDDLLDIKRNPARPVYDMASDVPLVLWDCIFPELKAVATADHVNGVDLLSPGYRDTLDWIYIGDEAGGRDTAKRTLSALEDGKHGRNGVMDELWALWRKRKMDEVLAWSLMNVVSAQGRVPEFAADAVERSKERSSRVFDGGELPRSVGRYLPVMQRERAETPEVLNARYALRKGLPEKRKSSEQSDIGEEDG